METPNTSGTQTEYGAAENDALGRKVGEMQEQYGKEEEVLRSIDGVADPEAFDEQVARMNAMDKELKENEQRYIARNAALGREHVAIAQSDAREQIMRGATRTTRDEVHRVAFTPATAANTYDAARSGEGVENTLYRALEDMKSGKVARKEWIGLPELTEEVFRSNVYRDQFALGSANPPVNQTDRPHVGTVLAPVQPAMAIEIIPVVQAPKTRFSWTLQTTRIVGDGSQATRRLQRRNAQVAEAGLAPEADFEYETQDVVLRHVIHTLPVTEEAEMSEPELVMLNRQDLVYGVRELGSEAIVQEDGTGNLISGFATTRPGLTNIEIEAYNTDTGTKLVTNIMTAIDQIYTTGRTRANFILLDYDGWTEIRDEKDSNGRYLVDEGRRGFLDEIPMRVRGYPVVATTEFYKSGAGGVLQATNVVGVVGDFARFSKNFVMGDTAVDAGLVNDDFKRSRRTYRAGQWMELVLQRNSAFRRLEAHTL